MQSNKFCGGFEETGNSCVTGGNMKCCTRCENQLGSSSISTLGLDAKELKPVFKQKLVRERLQQHYSQLPESRSHPNIHRQMNG